jgi:RNA polymerase sigma-70 factor (ECF subfamily)
VEREPEQILEARTSFEEACRALRPDLHRFCTRMTGSVADGEDLLQEALVHAFYHLPELRQGSSLRSWLFRIAHNCCVDWQRRRKGAVPISDDVPDETDVALELEQQELARGTLAAIFTSLPTRERASVVLRDVLGYSLEETAEITGSSVGAVKAAIQRAREKLERARLERRASSFSAEERAILEAYAERFSRHDWDGVRALLAEEARLHVAGRWTGHFRGRYLTNYSQLSWEFRLQLADVEGTPMIVTQRRSGATWQPHSVIALSIESGKVTAIRDYVHAPSVIADARLSPL